MLKVASDFNFGKALSIISKVTKAKIKDVYNYKSETDYLELLQQRYELVAVSNSSEEEIEALTNKIDRIAKNRGLSANDLMEIVYGSVTKGYEINEISANINSIAAFYERYEEQFDGFEFFDHVTNVNIAYGNEYSDILHLLRILERESYNHPTTISELAEGLDSSLPEIVIANYPMDAAVRQVACLSADNYHGTEAARELRKRILRRMNYD